MNYSSYLLVLLATFHADEFPEDSTPEPDLADVLENALQPLRQLVDRLRRNPLSPAATAAFEKDLQQAARELARLVTQWAYNHLEADAPAELPADVFCQGTRFHRRSHKTRQQASTLFGTITLWRQGYRAAPTEGEPVLFPLCQVLGLVHGATPALRERIAHYQAESGATQQQTRTRLRQEHGVVCGVKRLRQITAFVASALAEHQLEDQAEQVVRWLEQAQASPGRHRPVLSAGRDGITLGQQRQRGGVKEVATTGTLTVYDRRGQRLGTVYLAYVPEPGQGTMSARLTALIEEVLRRWQGPLPRLVYVTDAGDCETAYYRRVLRRLRHPRTKERLRWQWVVDYFHAAERLATMAEALFGKGLEAWGWMRRMQKLLLKPGGVGRVLHSAAALRSRLQPRGARAQDFRRAYRYLQARRQHLRYAEYRRLGLPIGSGVTEAGCKTVYTQRLKLSGMRWKESGAQVILTLRVVLLSGIWEAAWARILKPQYSVEVRTPAPLQPPTTKKRRNCVA